MHSTVMHNSQFFSLCGNRAHNAFARGDQRAKNRCGILPPLNDTYTYTQPSPARTTKNMSVSRNYKCIVLKCSRFPLQLRGQTGNNNEWVATNNKQPLVVAAIRGASLLSPPIISIYMHSSCHTLWCMRVDVDIKLVVYLYSYYESLHNMWLFYSVFFPPFSLSLPYYALASGRVKALEYFTVRHVKE